MRCAAEMKRIQTGMRTSAQCVNALRDMLAENCFKGLGSGSGSRLDSMCVPEWPSLYPDNQRSTSILLKLPRQKTIVMPKGKKPKDLCETSAEKGSPTERLRTCPSEHLITSSGCPPNQLCVGNMDRSPAV